MRTYRRVSILCGDIVGFPHCVDILEVSILCVRIGGCPFFSYMRVSRKSVHIAWTHRRMSIACGHIGGCP